jgi:Fe-S oxidoreductase
MCPSYRASKDEKDTTRARANALREFLTNSYKINKFDHEELKEVFDLCLSCKACASECPSNVDIATLKAEFLYQYQKTNGMSFRTKMFAENVKWNKLGSITPALTNAILNTPMAKSIIGIAKERSIPKLAKRTFHSWYKKNKDQFKNKDARNGSFYLFMDEYTNFYDVNVGIDAVELMTRLGYEVIVTKHEESGRSFISKGVLDKAKEKADANISHFKDLITKESPLVGLEPSGILGFRDEFIRLADDKDSAKKLAKNSFTIEEFFAKEIKKGKIAADAFTDKKKVIKIHGHCHQKSLSGTSHSFNMLNLPVNYKVTVMNTGCCGMAGSFGYEKEHYEFSMKVGEDSLFPKIRNTDKSTGIAAAGTSCRHQIKDGTKREAEHPVSILRKALK